MVSLGRHGVRMGVFLVLLSFFSFIEVYGIYCSDRGYGGSRMTVSFVGCIPGIRVTPLVDENLFMII